MKTANYHIIGGIYSLLERIELMDGIQFGDFDPDDKSDAVSIAENCILPSLAETSDEKKRRIRWTIEYYSTTGSAPFQLLRDRCQELTLTDADDWKSFFVNLGQVLFKEEFLNSASANEYVEALCEEEAEMIFAKAQSNSTTN